MISLTTSNICCIVERARLAKAQMTYEALEQLSYGDKIDKDKVCGKIEYLGGEIAALAMYSSNNVASAIVVVNIYGTSTTVVTINGNIFTYSNATITSFATLLTASGYTTTLIAERNGIGIYEIVSSDSTAIDGCSIVVTSGSTVNTITFDMDAPNLTDNEAYQLIANICGITKFVGNDQFQDSNGGGIVGH